MNGGGTDNWCKVNHHYGRTAAATAKVARRGKLITRGQQPVYIEVWRVDADEYLCEPTTS